MTAPLVSASEPESVAALGRFDRWLLTPAPAQRLAALRILVGGFVVVYLVATVGEFARLANRDENQFEAIGLANLLSEPLSPLALWILFGAAILSGAAFVTGTLFRFSGPLFALLTLFWASYHSSWGQMLHFEHLFTLHLLILGFSPAADAWALDLKRSVPVGAAPSVRYGWPIRLMAIVTVVTYPIAGFAKLRISGLSWIDGSTLGNHIAYSATRIDLLGGVSPPLASLVVGRGWLIAPIAVAALAVELLAPIALLGDRWRRWWVAGVLFMHLGSAATMLVWFPYQGLGFVLLPLYRAERILQPALARFPGAAERSY